MTVTTTPTMPVEPPKMALIGPKMSKGYTFRLRQHLTGNFHGLWELAILNANDQGSAYKIISDADALNFCMENLMGELEAEGL